VPCHGVVGAIRGGFSRPPEGLGGRSPAGVLHPVRSGGPRGRVRCVRALAQRGRPPGRAPVDAAGGGDAGPGAGGL